MITKLQTLVFASAVAAFALAGTLVAADKPSNNVVTIQNFTFTPETLTVRAGTKVIWINKDAQPHRVTSVDKKFRSRDIPTGKQFAFTFKNPGTYNYFCSIHPYMKGKVVVEKEK